MDGLKTFTRRQIGSGIAASAAIVGFDQVSRAWITEAAAAQQERFFFARAPRLDGVLATDEFSRKADSVDQGNIISRPPSAVLRPGSVADIQKMVAFCRRYGIKVATRGQHHTTFGQGLTSGLIIENASLNKIHSIGPNSADVDAGVLWHDLIVQAYNSRRVSAPVITTYTGLSIAGTLSVGGISPAIARGPQISHVQYLEVVTGTGERIICSPSNHADLFYAMLGGLGQCGIITRAIVDLIQIKPMARTYNIHYTDNATFFRDFRLLINRGEFDRVLNIWLPSSTAGLVYQLNATIFFDQDRPPDNTFLMRNLSVPPEAVTMQDSSYLDYIFQFGTAIQAYKTHQKYDSLIKPWFDVFLSDSEVEKYVGDVIPNLSQIDVGPTGIVLLFPLKRSLFTQPFLRVPKASAGNDWIYLFDLLTSSVDPGPNQILVDTMLKRNRTLFEKARSVGGTLYPIGSTKFSHSDWIRQYGEEWPRFFALKQKYDPANILTPGLGIFP